MLTPTDVRNLTSGDAVNHFFRTELSYQTVGWASPTKSAFDLVGSAHPTIDFQTTHTKR